MNMIDVNVDDFFQDVSKILLSLYQQFPLKISLYVEDISGPDEIDEFGLHSPRYLSCLAAIEWLHDEGFIRYSSIIHQESAEQCTLTQKAFTCLIKPEFSNGPSYSERQASTLAQRLYHAIQEQSGIDVQALIEQKLLDIH